jgi:hypothetical protein
MKQNRAIQMLRSTGLAILAYASLAYASLALMPGTFMSGGLSIADTLPTVNVGVYAQHSAGKIVYHYRVINNTQQTIAAIAIGRNKQNDGNPSHDVYELHELPSGWNEKFGIPAANSNSPTGWRVSTVTPAEESETHAVSWDPINDKTPRLFSGQTLAKMSVALDKADSNYITGHALITFSDGGTSYLTVPIERLDNIPPSLAVNLNPNTILLQENKFVAVNATFTAKDDYDRTPEIRLESITANEPLETDDIRDANIGLDDRYLKFRATSKSPAGRIYTVTYSATDASGNQTIASATLTVVTKTPATAPLAAPAPVKTPSTVPASTAKPAVVPHDQGEMKKP